MHSVSDLWRQIYAQPGHVKEAKVSIHGVEYGEKRIVDVDTAGQLFDAPSVGNAISRTLRLVIIPYDGPNGSVPPLSEIRLYVRLVSADGLSVSEFIPKGVFFSDTAELDPDTGAVTVSAFDALALAGERFGAPREGGGGSGGDSEPTRMFTVTFNDGYRNVQKFQVQSGGALPAPTTPTHEGQQFLSWNPDPADTPTVTRNLRFTARWAQQRKIVFEGGAEPQTFYCFAGDPTPTPETPSRDGFSFNGWLPPPPETVAGDATYTAQWAERTSVAIATYPARSDYYVGETLDYAGLSVIATYANGDAQDVTADCALLPAEGTAVSEVGDIMVDVRYNGKSLGTFWVAAQEVIAKGDWWALYENGLLDIYCVGDIPKYDNGYAPWYQYRAQIARVTISDSVTGIGAYAFLNCESLTRGTIGDNVTSIGYGAFLDCGSLTSVTIGDSVTSIGNSAFLRCASLQSVTIPDSVVSIEGLAFYGCSSLTSVTIPDSVETIGDYVFQFCGSLTSVTIGDSVTSIGANTFGHCSALTSVTIPNSVTSIKGNAFAACESLTSVTIPDSVTYIGEYAFWGCSSLTSVTIPDSVTSLREYAFSNCSSLTSVTIGDSVTYISSRTFNNCSALTSVTIGDSVTSISSYAFNGCSALTSVTIGDSVTSISSYAFNGCSALTSVTIPDSVTSIREYAFYETQLTSVTINQNCYVSYNAFPSGCVINYYD